MKEYFAGMASIFLIIWLGIAGKINNPLALLLLPVAVVLTILFSIYLLIMSLYWWLKYSR